MDSQSGSLQSSSGGGDEYSSCAAASNSLPSLVPHNPPPLFDPLSDFFMAPNNSPWPSSPRPVPNNPLLFNPFSPVPEPTAAASAAAATQLAASSSVAKNPRKRSRASRRAPTTVLTTDTSNFRAMVQEFTGIPAPPFASSPFTRAKLDLFGTPPSTGPATPPFLLRPFAHKFQPQQLPLQLPINFQNQSQSSINLQNDPVFSFRSLLNQANTSTDQTQLGGNAQNRVSSEGNLDILQEKGSDSQNVMEPWLCSSDNR